MVLKSLILPAAIVACLSVNAESSGSFRMTGTVSYVRVQPDRPDHPLFVIEGPTNALVISDVANLSNTQAIACGMVVDCAFRTKTGANGQVDYSATDCRILGRVTPPQPVETDIQRLLDGRFDRRLAKFTGTLRDVAVSETAPFWVILVVCDRNSSIFVSVPAGTGTVSRLSSLLGLRVRIRGVCVPSDPSNRLASGRTFKVASEDNITPIEGECLHGTTKDISTIRFVSPAEILSLGRHSAEGRVLATWDGVHALLKTSAGQIVGIGFQGKTLPRFDERIRVVGLPESDLFRINLIHASWTHLEDPRQTVAAATEATPRDVMPRKGGYNLVDSDYHGQALALVGIVRNISGSGPRRFYLECDNTLVPVDSHACSNAANDLAVGCRVRVSGTCVIQKEEQHGLSTFPRLKDFFLVLRTPADLEILSSPSWWTPTRLLGVISVLVLALGGIAIWNRSLANVAERRSRELLKARIARIASDLKVGERTRLSVELHDSLSQNLVGAAMEINTVEQLVSGKDVLRHLNLASRTIKASRDELRNCLWDLRSQALEEPDMNAAIRKTLEPYVSDVDLQIRFNVPRETFTDNTAHALMRIIRELVLNAIRHGRAQSIKIAGSSENGQLLFSVRDDGCGFDPGNAPGIGQGHFGLQGVRERLRLLGGAVNVESKLGTGTYVSARFRLPDDEGEKI